MAELGRTDVTKLTELNPRWCVASGDESRSGMGMTMDCPNSRESRIGVWFSNPLDGLPPISGKPLWERTGDSFENLTLSPSVRVSTGEGELWHGFVRDGEAVDA